MKKILFAALGVLVVPVFSAHAGITSLNGQTGNTQTFANDTNVTISSSGNVHTLGWAGVLQPARGGTGTSTVMSQGSILFAGASGAYSQDNADLNWDNTNKILGLGRSIVFTPAVDAEGNSIIKEIKAADQTTTNAWGNDIDITAGNGNGTGNGGSLVLSSGASTSGEAGGIYLQGADGDAGGAPIYITAGNSTSGDGGAVNINSGVPLSGNGNGGHMFIVTGDGSGTGSGGTIDIDAGRNVSNTGNGGAVFIHAGSGYSGGDMELFAGNSNGYSGPGGNIYIRAGTDNTSLNPGGNITFTTGSGSVPGKFYFGAYPNSTIQIGEFGGGTAPGCIELGDDDGGGITYVTAHRGVLSASTTKPSNCQ